MNKEKLEGFADKLKGVEVVVRTADFGRMVLQDVAGKVRYIVPNNYVFLDFGEEKGRAIYFAGYDYGICSISVYGIEIYKNEEVINSYMFNRFNEKKWLGDDQRKKVVSKGEFLID